MNCPNCGAPVTGQNKFCTSCGAALAAPVQNPQAPPPPQPVYGAPQPVYGGAPAYALPRRKKRIGLWIFLTILLLIIALAVWFLGSFSFLGPKNLGVKYTQEDFESAILKTGMTITFDGKSGQTLEEYKEAIKDQKLSIKDYNWEFSDYQEKTFTLTPQEATALLNNIAPNFWWFEDIQVNILPDGTMEGSSTVDVERLKNDLLSDVADDIPITLPESINIYSKGRLSITDNAISAQPEEFKVGLVTLPEEYMTAESVDVMEEYFARIYTIVPGLEIKSLGTDSSGNFVFDGIIPQTVNVTPKN